MGGGNIAAVVVAGGQGVQIPGFDMQKPIGEGAMAFVWKAWQKSLHRTVAIKMLKPSIACNPAEITSFLREARAAAALKHPGIVQIYDIGELNGSYYLVMEYIDGKTVGHLIQRDGPLPAGQALTIVRAVAEALDYAWEHAHLIHRDVKPHNILIDADGTAKLSDLGLACTVARGARAAADESDFVEGTPNYISPEQARGAPHIDCRSDMYSLGATLYHMVTGRVPFGDLQPADAARQQVLGRLPNPRDLVPGIPIAVAQLITRLMMRSPAARFDSWPEAIEAIRRAASGRMMVADRPPAEVNSTVAPPATAEAAAPTSPAAVRRSPVTPPPRPTPAAEDPKGRRLRLILSCSAAAAWVAMLALWVTLAWHRTQLPIVVTIPEMTFDPKAKATGDGSATQAQLKPGGPGLEDAGARAAPSSDVGATTAAGLSREHLSLVTRHLIAEDFARAEEVLAADVAAAGSPAQAEAVRELLAFIRQVALVPRQIEDEFMRRVGTEITLTHKGQKRVMLLKAVAEGKAFGQMRTDKGIVPVEFEIADLDAAERCRWLGTNAAPSVTALKCILLLKSGDADQARELAPRCGPLSALLQQQLDAGRG
jgi:hypothetical protein